MTVWWGFFLLKKLPSKKLQLKRTDRTPFMITVRYNSNTTVTFIISHVLCIYRMYVYSSLCSDITHQPRTRTDMKRFRKLYVSVEALCSGFWCHLLYYRNVIPEIRDIFQLNPLYKTTYNVPQNICTL